MSETEHEEAEEPTVTDVPEPDQDPHEPVPDEADEEDAAELEPDTGDEQDVDDDSTDDPAAQQLSAADEAGIERAFKALANEATRHANRISTIMGEDALTLQPCPRCVTSDSQRPATPGFIWPNEIVPLLPADKAAVKLSIGEGVDPEYKTSDDAYTCVKCGGLGKYKTGSHVAQQVLISCDTCNGRGWLGQRSLSSTPVSQNGPVEPVFAAVGSDEQKPTSDPWGRLPDDPHYGTLPGWER